MNRFVIAEPKKCIGCRTCEVACVLAHTVGNETLALSPENFAPRLKVIKGTKISTAVMCRQCEDAPCVNVCPNGALVYAQNSVQVIQERCIGCKTCVVACPFDAMEVISRPIERAIAGSAVAGTMKAEAHKCDLCSGRDAGPACIPVCPTKAIHLVDRNMLEATVRKRQERAALDMGGGVLVLGFLH